MTDPNDHSRESAIPRIIKTFFSPKSLERQAEALDEIFDGLNFKSLPEYYRAVNALRVFGEAAALHYETEYAKRQTGGSE